MQNISQRLTELGLQLPQSVAPVAAYTPAILFGNIGFTSGQLPFLNGSLPQTGKVGHGDGYVSPADAAELAQLAVLNALAAIRGVLGSLDRLTQVLKVTGFVASSPEFTGQPAVINGASECLLAVFGEKIGTHSRSAVGVSVLPLDAPVEVEMVFAFS